VKAVDAPAFLRPGRSLLPSQAILTSRHSQQSSSQDGRKSSCIRFGAAIVRRKLPVGRCVPCQT